MAFRYRAGGSGPRRFPHEVGPRRLPDTLLEVARGGSWQVEDLDAGVNLVAGPGRVLVVPGERRHVLRMVHGRPMSSTWHMVTLEDGRGRDLLARLPRPFVLSAPASARATRALATLAGRPASDLPANVAYQRLGLELAGLLFESSPSPPAAAPDASEARLDGVFRFVRDHLHRPISRRDLARSAHLSPTRFHYVFVSATGHSPMRYVLEQRVRLAQRLLLHSTRPCKEIGEACGFATPAHFARSFRRVVGVPPQLYRAQLG